MFAELDETGAGEAQPMWGGLGSMRSVELDSVHHRAVFLASTPNHPFEAFAYLNILAVFTLLFLRNERATAEQK